MGEGLHPERVLGHCHGVWDDSTDSARGSLVVDDLGLIFVVLSVHGLLVRGFLWLLQFDIVGDVIGLAAQELLFVVFCIDDWGPQLLHVPLLHGQLAQAFVEILAFFL